MNFAFQSADTTNARQARRTMVLLIHVDAEEIRSELSTPVTMNGDFISEWSQRLRYEPVQIVDETTEVSTEPLRSDADDDDFNVPVRRRTS
jgi:hypothetical protein